MEIVFKGPLSSHSRLVDALTISGDSKRGVSAGHDGMVRVYDLESRHTISEFAHGIPVRAVAFNDIETMLYVLCDDRVLHIWSVETREELQQFSVLGKRIEYERGGLGRRYITSAAFSPGAKFLLVGSQDKLLYLVSTAPGARSHRFMGHKMPVFGAGFTHEPNLVWSYGQGEAIRFWDIEKRRELSRIGDHSGFFQADVSEDTSLIVINVMTPLADEGIEVWDGRTAKRLFTLTKESASAMAFRPGTHDFLTGTVDGTLILWNLDSYSSLSATHAHDDIINSVAFSPDGQRIMTSGGKNETVLLWELRS